mgnify:CR=1 FL=1
MFFLNGGQQFGQHGWMLARHIVVFMNIGVKIVEARLALHHHQLPGALTHTYLVVS